MLYYGYLLARAVSAALPLAAAYWIAERVADVWYLLSARTRENLRYNLGLVPTVTEDAGGVAGLSRKILRNFARMVAEFIYLPRLNPDNISRLVDVAGFEKLKDVVGDRTSIFITAHLGNWELGAVVAAMIGIDLQVVVYDHPDRRVARLFRQRREAKGLKVMSVKEAFQSIRKAAERSCIGIVADRDYTGKGKEVTFFGKRDTWPSGYAGLAVSAGVPVIPGFSIMGSDGRYHLILGDTLFEPARHNVSADEIIKSFVSLVEKCVEKYPEQWYLFEKIGERSWS